MLDLECHLLNTTIEGDTYGKHRDVRSYRNHAL